MKVILKQDVEKLGKAGDVVKVAPGYGRNYLIPKKLALEATPGNIKIAEMEKVAQARRDHREKEAATILAREIVKLTVTIRRKTGEGGALYGSVTALDIADFLITHKIDYRQAQDPAGRADQDDRGIRGADSSAPRRDGSHQGHRRSPSRKTTSLKLRIDE